MANPSKDHTAKPCKILECVCAHEYQDKVYGKWKRVHNPRAGGVYVCTVCGREREPGNQEVRHD